MTDLERDRKLRQALRDADPLRDATPEEEALALARIRAALGAAASRADSPETAWWRWALPAAALVLVLAVAMTGRPTPGSATRPAAEAAVPPRQPAAEAAPAAGAPAPAGASESRQLQFETPGGTRIIWVLSPDLSL